LLAAREPDDYLLSHGQSALSSAWSRFTVLFGMGRGGTDSLWSSGFDGLLRRGGYITLGATANLEEVVERMPLMLGCAVFWHNTDLNLCVLETFLRFQRIPFGDRTSVSAKALTAVETHLL
jgi:hypothetical protein